VNSIRTIGCATFGDKKLVEGTLTKLQRHLRVYGWKSTSIIIAKNVRFSIRHALEKRFDRKLHVNTAGSIALEDLAIDSENKTRGVYYEPTPPLVFRHILSRLDIDHREFEFVDFGCGKGRVIVLAARYPFEKIIGIEFAPELADVARRNLITLKDELQRCANIEILCMDATHYEMPDSKAVLYFFNPFDATIMEAILRNLEASFLRSRNEKYVIYYNPQSEVVFGKFPFLQKQASAKRVIDFASPRFSGYSIYKTIN
jgi:SAM-dependent methyltransferase